MQVFVDFFQLFWKFFSSVTVTVVTVVFGTIQNSKNSFIFILYKYKISFDFFTYCILNCNNCNCNAFCTWFWFFCAFIWWCGRIVVTLRRVKWKKCSLTCTFLVKNLVDSERRRTFATPEPAKPLHDAQMCGSFFSIQWAPEYLFISHMPVRTIWSGCFNRVAWQ